MKFEKNNRYFNIAAYVFLTWLAILVVSCIVLNLGKTFHVLLSIIGVIYMLLEPLIIGLIIAYLVDPLVDFYEKRCQTLSFSNLFHQGRHKNKKQKEKRWPMRTVPTLFAFLTIILVLGIFILLIIMNIEQVAGEISLIGLKASVTGYIRYFEKMINSFSDMLENIGFSNGQVDLLGYLYGKVNKYVISFYLGFIDNLTVLGVHTMNILLAFVIAFYLLQDSQRLWMVNKRLWSKILGNHYHSTCILLGKIDRAFTGFIIGEVLDSIIITILTAGALILIRLDFAIIIGIVAGLFNLIPYFGPIVGFVLAVIIGLIDANPMKAVYGAIAILIIQQIDGWFIAPKIVGNCVKLHPVIVLLAILVGGNLFGLLGMLLAVPVAAIIRILLIYYFPDYFEEE